MFEESKLNFRIGRLQRQYRKINRAASKADKEANRDGKSPEERDEIFQDFRFDLDEINDDIATLSHVYIWQTARSLLVPVPDPGPPAWERSPMTGQNRLSADALHKLRLAIRQERRERWERWTRLIP